MFRALCLLAVVGTAVAASPPASVEERVKAGYLLQFARYTEWPPTVFSNDTTPLVICVVASDSFVAAVKSTVAGRKKQNRPFEARKVDRLERASGCHVLFLSREHGNPSAELKALAQQHTLTVGESDAFLEQGGTINLVFAEGSIRFDVNAKVADQAGLRISSYVLGLARQVVGAPIGRRQ